MKGVYGRERELALGDAFLDTAVAHLSVLVFEGEAGIGKTTVWREIARRAEERGFRVLQCAPAETETKLALSAVADLFEPVPDEAIAALPAPQRRAVDAALLRTDSSGVDTDDRTLATAVRSLLASLAADGPLLVAIDDVQWLDRSSIRLLEFALRRLADVPVGWLLTHRRATARGLALDRLVAPEMQTREPVGQLTPTALHDVLAGRLDSPLTRSALVRIHEASGGNPFHALEIARALGSARTADRAAIEVPDDLRTLIQRRLRRLPAPTREALLVASALAHPTVELVGQQAIAAAEEGELVQVAADGRIAFRHPLYASAVYGAAAAFRRRNVHRRLASRLTDPEERARHLALATTTPDEEVALALESAAASARSRGSWASAAEFLEQAARLTPLAQATAIARRSIEAAGMHVHAGDRVRARELLEHVLAGALPADLRADALHLLGEITRDDENFLDAERLFAEALTYADDPRLAANIELSISYALSNRMRWEDSATHALRALELAEAAGDDQLVSQALSLRVMEDYLCARGADWTAMHRSLELEDPHAVVSLMRRPSLVAACLHLYVGAHSEAREGFAELDKAMRELGDESDLAFALLWMSWLETRTGRFAAATAAADEASSLAMLTGSRSTHAWALTQQAYVQAHLGAVDETRDLLAAAAEPVKRSAGALAGLWIAASLALLELSLGDARAAWQACEPLVQLLEEHGIGEPVPAFFLPDALEALVALGQHDRAERLIEQLECRGHELDRGWARASAARCRALLLAAGGDLAGSVAAAERALAEYELLEMPFDRARALLVKGMSERRARKRARAKTSLEEALAEFERLGASLWAEQAGRELRRAVWRRTSDGSLTATEQRIAELAGGGLTNREVAALLFVSPKTVEANLARVYRKLDIGSRAELGARMNVGKHPM